MYKGHVINLKYSKKSTTPKFTVTYWKNDETEEEGEDVTMTLIEFVVNYILLVNYRSMNLLYISN